MRLLLISGLASGATCAYTPTRAEWSTTINPHKPLAARGTLYEANISSTEQLSYAIDVTIGSTKTKLLLDSGSFTVWTASPDYRCTDIAYNYTQEHCGITGVWKPDLDPTAPVKEADAIYASNYGSGFASGDVWNTTVTLAGLEVANLTIGYADEVLFDSGDGEISGIVGLGLGVGKGFYWNDASRGGFQPTGLFDRLKEKLEKWQFAM